MTITYQSCIKVKSTRFMEFTERFQFLCGFLVFRMGPVVYERLILRTVLIVVAKFKFVVFDFDQHSNKAVVCNDQIRRYARFILLILRLLKITLFIYAAVNSESILVKVVAGFLMIVGVGETSFRITLMKHGEELIDLINNLYRVHEALGKSPLIFVCPHFFLHGKSQLHTFWRFRKTNKMWNRSVGCYCNAA